jgi:hypothetical protein
MASFKLTYVLILTYLFLLHFKEVFPKEPNTENRTPE